MGAAISLWQPPLLCSWICLSRLSGSGGALCAGAGLLPPEELFHIEADAAFVIALGNMVCCGKAFRPCICHSHAVSCCLEHRDIVARVAEGSGLLHRHAQVVCQPEEPCSLVLRRSS